jgi:hypothetical protein
MKGEESICVGRGRVRGTEGRGWVAPKLGSTIGTHVPCNARVCVHRLNYCPVPPNPKWTVKVESVLVRESGSSEVEERKLWQRILLRSSTPRRCCCCLCPSERRGCQGPGLLAFRNAAWHLCVLMHMTTSNCGNRVVETLAVVGRLKRRDALRLLVGVARSQRHAGHPTL